MEEKKDGDYVLYDVVKDRLNLLDALEAAGVDNWQGYGDAQEMLQEG